MIVKLLSVAYDILSMISHRLSDFLSKRMMTSRFLMWIGFLTVSARDRT